MLTLDRARSVPTNPTVTDILKIQPEIRREPVNKPMLGVPKHRKRGVSMDASAPPLEAFSDTEGASSPSKVDAVPSPPMPGLGALGVHEPYVRSLVRHTRDWPKDGINFMDMSPLLADMRGLKHCVDCLVERYSGGGCLTHVAGVDARGFTLGCARTLCVSFLAFVRKHRRRDCTDFVMLQNDAHFCDAKWLTQ